MFRSGGRPKRDVAPVNYNKDKSEEDLEEGFNFDSPLTSPRRPVHTREGSPQELAYPTLNDNVDEELDQVRQTLQNIGHTPLFRGDPEGEEALDDTDQVSEEVEESGLVAVQADGGDCQVLDQPVRIVNYDQENADDDAGAIANARDVKLPFNKHDIKLWFSLVESKMQFAGIKKQWSKRQVVIQLIPAEFHNDFKQYLIMQETDAGEDAYFRLKTAMVMQFGPKQADSFDKAISRVMTGTPSQLGRQILNDVCPGINPLTGCHCADMVLGVWRRNLPSVVRNAVADMDFNANTFAAVLDRADKTWSSNNASTPVASLRATEVAATSSRAQ